LEVFGFVPFAPPRYLVQTHAGNVELFQSAPISMRLSAGIAYVFE
jgi:hypothetical protein